jgi:hypothetical protein
VSTIVVDSFLIDDENEEKFWSHGITADQVLQLLDTAHTIKKN